MSIPTVNFTIVSGGLGNVPNSPAGTVCVVGCSSAGSANTVAGPYSQPQQVITDNGYGPGSEAAAYYAAAGIPVLFVKTPSTTAATTGSVTHNGTGVSVLSLSGTPFDAYNVVVTVTRSGTVGSDPEPGITISLDGGQTVSREIRIPSSGSYTGLAATTGLTFAFTTATTVAGDTYTFSTVPPKWSGSDITAALAALKGSTKLAELVHVVGPMSATNAGLFDTALSTFAASKKFIRGIGESVDLSSGQTEAQWIAAIEADYVTFASNLVGIAATPCLVPSAISGVQFRRSIAWAAMRRAGGVKIGRDLAAVEDGALTGITTVYHDEALVPGLDADRFITATSINGLPGYFLTNPNLMASPSSDFTLLQYGRVMDQACRTTYNFFVQKLSTDVRLNKTTGFILEKDARALESGNNTALKDALITPGNVSDATTIVSRTDNISSTKTLTVTVKLLPLGYLKTINITMTFTNPALGG